MRHKQSVENTMVKRSDMGVCKPTVRTGQQSNTRMDEKKIPSCFPSVTFQVVLEHTLTSNQYY